MQLNTGRIRGRSFSNECLAFLATPYYGGPLPRGCMIHDVSPYGVHDMGGSVREFVEDDYLSAAMLGITTEEFVSTVALDGSPWVQSPRTDGRMIKGGHWAAAQPSFISAKGYVSNGYGSWSAGFRCAADL